MTQQLQVIQVHCCMGSQVSTRGLNIVHNSLESQHSKGSLSLGVLEGIKPYWLLLPLSCQEFTLISMSSQGNVLNFLSRLLSMNSSSCPRRKRINLNTVR